MAKHSRENGADLFAIPFALLRRRQKMVNALLRTMPSWSDCSNELTIDILHLSKAMLCNRCTSMSAVRDFALLAAWAMMGEGI